MEVSEENLRKHIRYLASPELDGREFNTKGDELAAEYIHNCFHEYGLEAPSQFPDYIQKLPEGGQNVIGILRGSDERLQEECIIVDAHHDHVGNGFLGASDNAAGVAVLLELARIFGKIGTKRTLLFTCFDAEEQLLSIKGRKQMMYGASYYILDPVFDIKRIFAMLTLDTLGRNVLGDLIFILGAEHSLLIQDIVYECQTNLRKIMFEVDMLTGIKGNYIPFVEKKIPSLFITNGMHKDYHSTNDTENRLQYGLLIEDTRFVRELVSKLSDSDGKPDFCKNPIPPKSEVEDILYLLKLLQGLIRKTSSDADRFDYIISKLEERPKKEDLRHAVQIILGFMTPNYAKLYLLLNDAQMAEKKKEHSVALQHYKEIIALYDQYRIPYLWLQDINDKIAKLEEKSR